MPSKWWPGDHRQVMIGADMAEAQGLGPDDRLTYQGRDLTVRGVFETGLLADSEVWLDLKEADRLFNAQGYVSTFAIEDDPALTRRIEQRLELEVVIENEVWKTFNSAGRGLFTLLRLASGVAAVASVLGAMNVMFTMARQRRRSAVRLGSEVGGDGRDPRTGHGTGRHRRSLWADALDRPPLRALPGNPGGPAGHCWDDAW